MATITLRSVKGTPLTVAEVDANFSNLNSGKIETTDAVSANTANAVVRRDSSGNFSAGTITAALSGNATTATQLQTARTINGTSFNGSANITTSSWGSSRTISFTGDATGSSSVDGSTNVATQLTLANSGVTAGTYGSSTAIPVLTVDSKGRVTSASTSSITVGDGQLSINTSGGLTGSVTFSANQGTASSVTISSNATSANTASTIVARDASGNFSAGTITATLSGNATTATSISGTTTAAIGSSALATGTANSTTYLRGDRTWSTIPSPAKATSTALGLVELFSDTVQTTAANAVTTTASRTYGIQLNSSDQAVVNVPWTDTTYSQATTSVLGLIRLGSDTAQTVAANAVTATASRTYAVQLNASGQAVVNVPWVDTDTNTITRLRGTTSGTYTSGDLTLLASGNISVTQNGSDFTISSNATSANTVSTIVARDASGNFSAGTITVVDLNSTSDRNAKTNIEPIEDALNIINQIDGKSFQWKDTGNKSYGVIAQEIQQVLPELVSNGDAGLAVSYTPLIAILIEAVKQQDARLKALEALLN